jgi:hypothetical protein
VIRCWYEAAGDDDEAVTRSVLAVAGDPRWMSRWWWRQSRTRWEADPSLRDNELGEAFADVWCAIPEVVFSRTLHSVQGNARLAEASVAGEVAAAHDATDKHVGIGSSGLAAGSDRARPRR